MCLQFEARLFWSSGLVVAVFVCGNVYGGVCSFVCLFADSCLPLFLWLVGWLLVSMCACLFFGTLQRTFMSYSHFGKPFCAFLALWGALRLHCNAWGSTLPPLVTYLCMFSHLVGHWAQFVDFWAPFGHLWGPFWCVFVALWPDPGPLFRVFWKRLEKESKKKRKRELKWMYFQ